MSKPCYYGKYRAKVVDVQDPQKRGRIRVMCPKVLGEAKSSWCEPCVPVAYDLGGDFAIPKVGEFVWVEFEEGDCNKPIYTGGLWSSEKSPSSPYEVEKRFITWGDCKVVMTKDSVTVTAPSVTVDSPSVKVTSKAVEVTSPSVKVNGKSVALSGDRVVVDGKTGYIQ